MNTMESYVFRLYSFADISDCEKLSIDYIATKFKIRIIEWPFNSVISTKDGKYNLFINEHLTDQRKWQVFGHEMYHYFNDQVNYCFTNESFANYGEVKADYFSYHFCVPTFMLQQYNRLDVYDVMYYFNVEYDFALKRLEMYKNNFLGGINYGRRSQKTW